MDIEQFLAQIRERAWNTATLGRQFELLVKAFLKTEPLYANLYTDVWMWDECPYVSGRDTGMDLVARDIHGDFTGIQCKCYRPGTRVEKPDVDTFLSVLGSSVSVEGEKLPFRHGLYVVTNEDISDNARAALDGFRVPVNLMTLSVLRNSTIDWAHFNFGKTAKRVERHHEREHQKRAIKDVLDGFKTEERGQLIMACGTGKTFTALKITERMLAEKEKPSVLFLVPSIALLGQTLREWTAQAERPIFPVAVCSDPKASRKLSDDEQEAQGDGTASLGFPATTDSEKIRRFVKLISSRGKDGMLVVFSTYQSLDAVSEAQKNGALKTFDLIVCDEAHRTTAAVKKDNAESNFFRVHEQGFIKGRKRLYMTATPRVYSADVMRKADDEAILYCSMDDKTKFGPVFHTLNFSRVVSEGLLSDYKVLILAVSESEVRSLGFRDLNGDGELDNVDMVAKMVGSWKGLNKDVYKEDRALLGDDTSPMRSAVVFAANIRESKLFTSSFQRLVEEHYSEDAKLRPAQLRHVDGTMNALKRARDIEWLRGAAEDTECRVLSNAKCLSEGVDVPSLDAIVFLSPRKSTVEVVQAVGRVMRKDPKGKKKLGYVILPMMVPDGEDVSTVLDMNERYKVVWAVLTALRSHDNSFNALENKVEIIRVSAGTGSGGSSGSQPDPPPILIDRELFEKYKNAIHTKLARVCGEKKYWSVWAEDIARVVHAQITRFTLEGIPAKAHEYVLNGRSALEWIIDRYQIRTDKDSGITNDPNDWGREHGNPRYIVDLIQSVTTVSVKTVDLVKKLEGVRLREQNSGQDLQAGVRAANPVRNSEVLREIGEALKFREYLPVYSFKAACGPLAGGQEVEVEGWIKVEGHGKLDPTQFVVRTEGVSMEGLIPEGAMCIMRKLGGGGLEGKTILVQRNDVSDPEGGGAYTIKTFTRKGKKVVLKAKDSTYDISLKGDAEYSQKYRAIAEFKGVL